MAREEWGFDGYITSDCDADDNVISTHHYLNHTEQQGVADILHAGTDVDCGGNIGKYAQSALMAGTITEADMDERLSKLFRVRMRLGTNHIVLNLMDSVLRMMDYIGHFDPNGPLQSIGADQICSEESIAISMEGPIASATLIKNENKALPLSGATAGTIAVIGVCRT